MLVIRMTLPRERVNEVRKYGTETDAMQKVVQQLINENGANPDVLESASFKKYHEMYIESNTKFGIAREGIEKSYVPAQLRNENTTWQLDYGTCVLTITHKTEKYTDTSVILDISDVDLSARDIEINRRA